ncbi:dimethylaniline monooxygenase [N-oxide-forming] 2-like [Ylistrum balloti]|uniref:dimethylaniline monooxygenase [N-oxide-forming] 2-like n=1 Tax=Ylistrum balloti TaxID=509963 RepID=UPI002905A5E7|nr:dimethylaniline monooxygenase [N-oxide-forming] 2-like [Ylistrum balloti]
MSEEVKRVAVIGAGISGLSTLTNLLSLDRKYIPTCFERGSDVGGVWQYNENTHTDEYGMPVFSSIYRDLISNLPKPMMEFPDFPNTDPDNDSSFMHREDVMNYIKRYADHHDLGKFIRTHTYVTNVCPNSEERFPEWTVSYYDVRNKEPQQDVFDAVFVCTGHHHTPYIPDIEGVEEFQGEIIHSKNYRIPERFTNKRAVILGASFSGTDLATGISPYAKQIFLSHIKERLKSVFPENIIEKPGIKRMTRTSVVFLDDTGEEVDVLLFCTGYSYNFPFLSDDVINVNGNKVMPLYKHVVHVNHPNLLFVGILKNVSYFIVINVSSKFAVAVLNGDISLPSETDMQKIVDEYFEKGKERGEKPHTFQTNDQMWEFEQDLSKMAGIQPCPKAFELIRAYLIQECTYNLTTIRDKKFKISDDKESFQVLN